MIYRIQIVRREGPNVYTIVSYKFLGIIPLYINKVQIQ